MRALPTAHRAYSALAVNFNDFSVVLVSRATHASQSLIPPLCCAAVFIGFASEASSGDNCVSLEVPELSLAARPHPPPRAHLICLFGLSSG